MNILYIIGNGFDKAQGMATSYPEFYEYLKRKKCSPRLEQMKKEFNNKELWSDMEIALGIYTENFSVSDEYLNLHYELIKELCLYLTYEEDKYNPSDNEKTTFKTNILRPQEYLLPYDKESFNKITQGFSKINFQASFISLNYTNTLLKLLSVKKEMKSYMDINTDNCSNILYLHGYLKNNGIIVGVSDAKQIKNESLKTDPDIEDILIKERSNVAIGNTSTAQCENMIRKADMIVIYGSSLGDTDNYLWKIIENRFKSRGDLCIIQHIHNEDYNNILPQQRKIFDRKFQNILLKKLGFEEFGNKESIRSRLFITYNQNLTKPINLRII